MSKVNVYEDKYGDNQKVIARVNYNSNLDYWDGHNWTNGGAGMHKGITRLKNGKYVIIIGSQWQGSMDYAYIVSDEEALQEILNSGHVDLLDSYSDLKRLYEETMLEEEEE